MEWHMQCMFVPAWLCSITCLVRYTPQSFLLVMHIKKFPLFYQILRNTYWIILLPFEPLQCICIKKDRMTFYLSYLRGWKLSKMNRHLYWHISEKLTSRQVWTLQRKPLPNRLYWTSSNKVCRIYPVWICTVNFTNP